jgi:hypothetical protein
MDCVIRRVVRVAAGAFAPGHIGELTRIVPFEMVDAVLAETGAQQRRVRDLPSRVVVYLLLAAALFADLGYGQVWARMIAGLGGQAGSHWRSRQQERWPKPGAGSEPRRCGRRSTWSAARLPECRCRGCAGRDGW